MFTTDIIYSTTKNNVGSTIAIASAATVGLLALKYNDRPIFTDRRKGTPILKGAPLVGILFGLASNKERMLEWFHEKMDIMNTMTMFVSGLGFQPMIVTIDPVNINYVSKTGCLQKFKYIENFSNYVQGDTALKAGAELFGHGIFVIDGEKWRHERKVGSIIFNSVTFRDSFTQVFVEEIGILSKHVFDIKSDTGKAVDFQGFISNFTFEVFVKIGFGKNLNILTSKERPPFVASFEFCRDFMFSRLKDPFTDIRDTIKSIFYPKELSHKDHVKIMNSFVISLIDERRGQLEQGHEFQDLLSSFMNTPNKDGEPMDNQELRDMIINFLIAGRDTIAQTISWILCNVLSNPEVEAKFVEEVDQYITDDAVTSAPKLYEAIKKMTYAHAVLHEALRFDTVVGRNAKTAVKDDVLPDGTQVCKGDLIFWNAYSMGLSEKVWGPDAKEFKPERWILPNGELAHESSAKWPIFHLGPRSCIGKHISILQSLVGISLLLKRYKFKLASHQNVNPKVSLPRSVKDGLYVFIEKR